MYLNRTKIWTQRMIYGAAALFLTEFALFMVLGIIFTLTGIASFGDVSLFIAYIAIVFIFLDIICMKALIKTFRAGKLNRILEKETEGLLSTENAAKSMKMQHQKFMVVFMDCVSRDLLQKCTLYAEDPTYILLENGAKDIREKYAVVHCSRCGAPNAIRIGFSNKCKYCSADIKK